MHDSRWDRDLSNRSRGRSVYRDQHASLKGRATDLHRGEEARDKGKTIRDASSERQVDLVHPECKRLTYADAAKGVSRKELSTSLTSHWKSVPESARTTKQDDEGEWVLVRSRKIIKAEKRQGREESASSGSGQQCHKCALWGHTISQCPNRWFCYACRRSGHISRDCPTRKMVTLPSPTAPTDPSPIPRAPSPTKSNTSKTQESYAGGRATIKVLITPTPLMAEFERRFRMCCVIKVQSGNPLAEDIELLLNANISPSATLEWRVQHLSIGVFFVHCHDEARLNEVLGKRGMGTDDFFITFSQWSRKLGALKAQEMPSVWLRLFNFPFHCWLRSGFQNLVRSFGYLLEVDKGTTIQTRRDFARIKVGCKNFSDIPSMIQAEFEGEFFDVKVIVEKKKKNVSFGKVSSREEEERSDDRHDGPRGTKSKVDDDRGPSDLAAKDIDRSSRLSTKAPLLISDEYGSNLEADFDATVRRAGSKEESKRPLDYQRHVGQEVTVPSMCRKPGILKIRSNKDNEASDYSAMGLPQFAAMSEDDLQLSIQKAIEELARRAEDAAQIQAPAFQGDGVLASADVDAVIEPINPSVIRTGPSIEEVSHIGVGLVVEPAGLRINSQEIAQGNNLDDEILGDNSNLDMALLEGLDNHIDEDEADSEVPLDQDDKGVDPEILNGMIGALDGIQSGGFSFDSEHEKWAKQVRELAGGGVQESGRGTMSKQHVDYQRKSKRQLDKWGSSGPSEGDLIRAAAKTKEPSSACLGLLSSRKKRRLDGEE